MSELCLMASHGYPPGLVLHQEQSMSRVIKDCQTFLPSSKSKQEIFKSGPLNLQPHQNETLWKPVVSFSEYNHLFKTDSTVRLPVVVDGQEEKPGTKICSGMSEQSKRNERILQFLTFGPSEQDMDGSDILSLSDLMALRASPFDTSEEKLVSSLIYSNSKFDAQKPLMDFVGELVRSSKITVTPNGRVFFTGTGTEMKDVLSVVAEFYSLQNSPKWRSQSMLIPCYNRLDINEVQNNVSVSSVKFHATVLTPVKSPDKIKLRPFEKKKNGKKEVRQRDLYKKNYFHACETLLSLMINKKQRSKTSMLSLKKSGPELPNLLTQFSAGIAGTGLAVLFSVICKAACGRVPLCGSKLVSTGFGFGLVWLSWSVNKLRDTIVYISKNKGESDLKEKETMKRVDKSVNEIYFRAATLMAVAVLRIG